MPLNPEQILKAFDWSQQFHLNAWAWQQTKGMSAGAKVGDEFVKVDISLNIPVAQMEAAILPLMTALTFIDQVAHADDKPIASWFAPAVQYVAKAWFPTAALDYALDQAEDFISDGAVNLDPRNLFDQVMERVFWHSIALDMDAPEGFENAIFEAVDDQVFKTCLGRLEETAAEWRSQKNINGYHGVSQSDFVSRR